MTLKDLLLTTLFFLLVTVITYPAVLIGGKILVTTGLIHSDLLNQNFPFHWQYALQLKRGGLWFWSNLIGNGFPVFAIGQIGQLYPVNLLLSWLLNPLAAFNLSLFPHLGLAGLGTFLYCRKLKLSSQAGLIAGLSFAFSGFLTTHLMHVAMIQVVSLVPFNLLLIEVFLKKPTRPKPLFWLALVWALQALAGHHEILYFIILIEFLYLTIRTFQTQTNLRSSLVGNWVRFGLAGLVALLLAAPQLLPTIELVRRSPRAQGVSFAEATGYRFPLGHLLTLVNPHAYKFSETVRYDTATPDAINLWETYLYLGLIPLGLAIVGFIKKPKTASSLRTAWAFILITAFLLALGRTTPLFGIFWRALPLIRLFKSPTRFLLFVELALAILAGIGWDSLFQDRLRGKMRFALASLVIVLIIADLKANNARIHLTDEPNRWLTPPPTARLIKFKQGTRYHSLSTNHLDYRLTGDLETQRHLRNLLPSNYGMLFGLPAASFQAGLFTSEQLYLLRGSPRDILAWDDSTQQFIATEGWLHRLSLQSAEYILTPIPISHPMLKLVGSFRFPRPLPGKLLFRDKAGAKPILVNGTYVYRNLVAFPRAFLVKPGYFPSRNPTQDLNLLINPNLRLPTAGSITIRNSTGSDLNLEVTTSQPATLVLLDLDYPGWQVRVDNQPAPLFRAYAFRALDLTTGRHLVQFSYQPQSFRWGVILALAGVIIWIVGLVKIKNGFN